jgi:hypothetical protein
MTPRTHAEYIAAFLEAGRPDLADAYIDLGIKCAELSRVSQRVLEGARRDLVDTTDLLAPVE